jgi:fermentation-respiration switch protein FrsA (DUF1100 family)
MAGLPSAALLFLAGVVALYLAALGALYVNQRKLLYFPNWVAIAPAEFGLKVDVVHLKTSDGETLLAWHVRAAAGKPLILYFHGNGGGLPAVAARLRELSVRGDGILAVEYRGYAGSTGRPSETGLLTDGEAAYAWAIAEGFAPARIVARGESLGSGVAVALAARHEVGAVVLDSPYTSTVDVAAARFWMFPARALMWDTFRSDQRIAQVTAPLLIVHGTEDKTIPIRFGERLFSLAHPPKSFIRVEGYGHLAMGARIPQVLDWIERQLR